MTMRTKTSANRRCLKKVIRMTAKMICRKSPCLTMRYTVVKVPPCRPKIALSGLLNEIAQKHKVLQCQWAILIKVHTSMTLAFDWNWTWHTSRNSLYLFFSVVFARTLRRQRIFGPNFDPIHQEWRRPVSCLSHLRTHLVGGSFCKIQTGRCQQFSIRQPFWNI